MTYTFKLVNFSDLTDSWLPADIMNSDKYSAIYWKTIAAATTDELRDSLAELVAFTGNRFTNNNFSSQTWYNPSSPHRHVSRIFEMKRETVIKHLNFILSADLNQVLKEWEKHIWEEKERIANLEVMFEKFNNMLN